MVNNPVQARERYHPIELLMEVQYPSIPVLEAKLRYCLGGERLASEVDHLRRRIQADDSATGDRSGDFRRNLSVAAPNVENVLIALQLQSGE